MTTIELMARTVAELEKLAPTDKRAARKLAEARATLERLYWLEEEKVESALLAAELALENGVKPC